MNTDKKLLEEKQAIVGKMQEVYDSLKEENRKCTEALKAAQKRYEAISMGKFSDGEGESATLQQQGKNIASIYINFFLWSKFLQIASCWNYWVISLGFSFIHGQHIILL